MKIKNFIINFMFGLLVIVLASVLSICLAEVIFSDDEEPVQTSVCEDVISDETVEEAIITSGGARDDIPLDAELQHFINNVARYYDLDPLLVYAVIETESGYNPLAYNSGSGCYGLMQVRARSHYARMETLGVTDLFNPYENVMVGIDILAEKVHDYDTLHKALMAYNGGNGYCNKRVAEGITSSSYSEEVLGTYYRLSAE